MKIFASKRFLKAYNRASLGLKDLAVGAVHHFVHLQRSNPATVLNNYDNVRGLRAGVWEIDISGSHRLLASYEKNRFTMLDMGGHEIVGRYTDQKCKTDLASSQKAPGRFWPGQGHFFRRNLDDTLPFHYNEEQSSDWLYFLEKKQTQVNSKIESRIWKMINGDVGLHPFFILGGPGTGKTCILLNLLHLFGDIDESFDVNIFLAQPVVDYIEQSTNANITQYRPELRGTSPQADLLLVDDPSSQWEIERVLKWQRDGLIKAVVIAFDPLQLKKALPDDEFERIVEEYNVHTFQLSSCYRQKENVGIEAKHVMDMVAASTPFINKSKTKRHFIDHKKLTALSNELSFINPAGYVQYYQESKINDVENEVSQILENEWLMWKHTPGLLVVEGVRPGHTLTPETKAPLAPLEKMGYVQWVHAVEIESIKGLEFQHVFIFIENELFDQIQHGFSGLGRKAYHERRLMRIPFSRAKDRLVTFALDTS